MYCNNNYFYLIENLLSKKIEFRILDDGKGEDDPADPYLFFFHIRLEISLGGPQLSFNDSMN